MNILLGNLAIEFDCLPAVSCHPQTEMIESGEIALRLRIASTSQMSKDFKSCRIVALIDVL